MDLQIISVLDEQAAVGFTGRINILSRFNRQYLGHALMKEGELFQVILAPHTGIKAFYQLIIQEFSMKHFEYVVEPEVVADIERKINLKYEAIKTKMADVLKLYRESLKLRPPDNVKILVEPKFIESDEETTADEFAVLNSLTEWNSPLDVYQHCSLLDHEITLALVSLRKKKALKIVASR